MITSQAARQEQERKIVEEKITSAKKRGLHQCDIDIYVSDTTEKWLILQGCTIKRYANERDGSGTYVYW